jgi:hypothetical protein
MEIQTEHEAFQEGDRVRIKRTGETGSINATDGGVVYALMDHTNEVKIFAASVNEDAYIDLITADLPTSK